MQTKTLENPDVRDGVVWESQEFRVNGVEFQIVATMQDGRKNRGTYRGVPELLELELT